MLAGSPPVNRCRDGTRYQSKLQHQFSWVCNSEVGGFKASPTSMIPELLLPLTCCVTLDKPLLLSEPWLLHLLNEKLKVNYLRGSLALRISHLNPPGALPLSLSPKRWKVGLELGRGEQSPPFMSGLCGLQWEVPFSFFLTFLKPESYFKLLSGELLKATRLRPHVLQPLVGRKQSWILPVLSPPPPAPRGRGPSSIHPLLTWVTELKGTCLLDLELWGWLQPENQRLSTLSLLATYLGIFSKCRFSFRRSAGELRSCPSKSPLGNDHERPDCESWGPGCWKLRKTQLENHRKLLSCSLSFGICPAPLFQ